jgi:hypothetical protein
MAKWMQEAQPYNKQTHRKQHEGALRDYFGIKEGEKIPTEKLNAVAARLHAKVQRGERLTASELKLSHEIQLALRYRESKH